MQKQLRTAPSVTEKLVQDEDLNIVSEFTIKNSCFIVISLSEFLEANHLINVDDNMPSPIHTYFEVDQHFYAVLPKKNFSEMIDANFNSSLTARELQIATIVAQGASNKRIASQLNISEWTVSAHLRRIFIKLNVDSRAAMVYKCSSLIKKISDSV